MTPTALAARAEIAPAPAPLRRPIAPRRVSGPPRHPRALPAPRRSRSPLVRLLDAPFLDRLIRGRLWIGLIAFALLGIVAMQVAILQLGASIGHSVTEIQRLSAANQAAETAIAQYEPGRNVASEARSLGMVYPPAGNIVYLHYSSTDLAAAADSITLPTAPLFTPAAASLTAPLAPASAAANLAASTTPTQTTATPSATQNASATNAPPSAPSTTTVGGSTASGAGVSATPAGPSGATALGAGGGSSAPTG